MNLPEDTFFDIDLGSHEMLNSTLYNMILLTLGLYSVFFAIGDQ